VDQVHFGSPSTVAGATAATPMKIEQVFVVALCVATALQPVPAVAVKVTVTPADGV
jgi:stage V sporulation protein SpoVS